MPTESHLRIVLVQDWLTGFAGGEQVLLALHQMYPEAPIYTSVYNAKKTPQFAQANVVTSYLQHILGGQNHHQLLIPLMPQAFESFNLKEFDVVISIGGGLSKGVITHPGQRHVSYCHTPMRYIWKLSEDSRNDGHLDSGLRHWAEHKLRIWDVVSAKRVDTFIANSHNVSKRIEKIYRMPSQVVYPPVNVDHFQVSKRETGDYFLSVGRLIAYKRIDLLVAASIITKQPLKIVGDGPERKKLVQLAAQSPWIEFVGRVPDAQLNDLYACCKAFVFAAEEDFGIVPLEAMASGRPVIAFAKGGALETVINEVTGTFFAEQTAECLAETMLAFKSDQYKPEECRSQAEKFSISIFQKHMRDIVDSGY